jgi:hypothetical protein
MLGGGTLWHSQRFLQCIKYIILEFIPSTTLLYLPPPIPGMVSTGIIFAFTYMCTHFLYHINCIMMAVLLFLFLSYFALFCLMHYLNHAPLSK